MNNNKFGTPTIYITKDEYKKMQKHMKYIAKVEEFAKVGDAFFDSPFKDNTFKRDETFYKYVDNVSNLVAQYIKTMSYKIENKETLYNIIVNCAIYGIEWLLDEYTDKKIDKTNIMPHDMSRIYWNISYIKYFQNKEIVNELTNMITQFDKNSTFDNEFLKYAKQEFANSIQQYLLFKYIESNNKENFVRNYYKRKIDDMEIFRIFLNTNSLVMIDIIHWVIAKLDKDYNKSINKLTSNFEKEKTQYEYKISDLTQNNNKLKEQLNNTQDIDDQIAKTSKIFESELYEKDKLIQKMTRKYEALQDKYNNLLLDTMPDDVDNIELEDEIVCDTNLKYVFVMKSWSKAFEQQLLDTFPNSRVVKSTEQINDTVDMVIFMTTHLKHHMYYDIKDYCKNTHIPYMHFSSTNMDILKINIAETLYKE